jgi:hypothetical protein
MANIKHLVLFLTLGWALAQPGTHGEKRRREGHEPLPMSIRDSCTDDRLPKERSAAPFHASHETAKAESYRQNTKPARGRPLGYKGGGFNDYATRAAERHRIELFRARHDTSQVRIPSSSAAKRAASGARGERPPPRSVPIPLHYLLLKPPLSPYSRHPTTMPRCLYLHFRATSLRSVCSTSRFSICSPPHTTPPPPSPSSLLQHPAVAPPPHLRAAAAPMTTQVRGVPTRGCGPWASPTLTSRTPPRVHGRLAHHPLLLLSAGLSRQHGGRSG